MNWYKKANILSATILTVLQNLEDGVINMGDTEIVSAQIPIGTPLPEIQDAINSAMQVLGKTTQTLNQAQQGLIEQLLSQYGDLQNQDMGYADPIEPIGQPPLERT